MSRTKRVTEALTFSDVSLMPRRSEILPREAVLTTRFSKHITLGIPLSSAAMDTVTESRLAIAMARLGGIGIIHKNLAPSEQAAKVARVKRSESGMIADPFTVGPKTPLKNARAYMDANHVSGVPVVDKDGKLVGILTNRDLRFEEDDHKLVREVMTRRKLITAPQGTTLADAKELFRKHRIEKLPIIDGARHLKGLLTANDLQNIMRYPSAAKDKQGRLLVGAAVGTSEEEFARACILAEAGVDVIVVDTAHGHSAGVIKMVRRLKGELLGVDIVGGNIATAEAARDLIRAGADAIKIGMGAGSICTTRMVAGIGVPQLTAIMNCAPIAAKHGVPLIADGGIEYSGDITKAIAAGASSIMIGSLFAGTDETPGEIVLYQDRSYKDYRGMGSLGAMAQGSAGRYMQEGARKFVPEGVEGLVPARGPLINQVEALMGGLRQGMGYMGCRTIADLNQQGDRFIRVTAAGLRESHVHGVTVTKEPPNYRLRTT